MIYFKYALILFFLTATLGCNKSASPKLEESSEPSEPSESLVAETVATKISFTDTSTETFQSVKDLMRELYNYNAGEILIQKTDLGNRIGQDYYLERSGPTTIIKYTTEQSLDNAVYTLLENMGFHWYGPGENWVVRPDLIYRKTIKGSWKTPSFRNRDSFGTGGLDFQNTQAYDPNNDFKKNWNLWKKRSRLNADFEIGGHTGMAFYQSNQVLLDSHPEWFTSTSGKENGRIKVEIPEAVQAYKDWCYRINQADVGKKFVAVNTDPEDSRGGPDDPLPPPSTGLMNHADKWWYVTNEVSKMYDENDNKTIVSAYAYGDGPSNALVPNFVLRKNVYPMIIPYAFQTAYLPTEMIRQWASKVTHMGIYDYWNITQWSQGLPQFDIYSLKDKLTFWRNNKIDGITVETTSAAGPMGHGWWLASQLMFDTNKNFESAYNQYLSDCFGPARFVMREMFDRWSKNNQGSGEVSQSLSNLQRATSLVTYDGPEWKRLNELKAYVHYMKMFYEHDNTQANKNRIFNYLYSIHHLMLVQTSAFIDQYYINPLTSGNVTPVGSSRKITPEEIETNFISDLQTSPKLYDIVPLEFDFNKVVYTVPVIDRAWRFGNLSTSFRFRAPRTETIRFTAGAQSTGTLTVYNDDQQFIREKIGTDNFTFTDIIDGETWSMKNYSMPVVAGKDYYILFQGGFNRFVMKSQVVMLKHQGGIDFDNYDYPAVYFYIPKAATEIVYYDGDRASLAQAGGLFYNPDGVAATAMSTGTSNIYKVSVPPQHRGKIWKAQFGHTDWSLKNVPNYGSLAPFQYNE